ncbi:MAG: hypothetical protein ACTTIO_05230 [Candidatus Fimenecus sp.]
MKKISYIVDCDGKIDCGVPNELLKINMKPCIDYVLNAIPKNAKVYITNASEQVKEYLGNKYNYADDFSDVVKFEIEKNGKVVLIEAKRPLITEDLINFIEKHPFNLKASALAIFYAAKGYISENTNDTDYIFCGLCILKDASFKKAENIADLLGQLEDIGKEVEKIDLSLEELSFPCENGTMLMMLNSIIKNNLIIEYSQNGICFPCADGIIISPDVKIGAGTTIYPNTILEGNTVIGENCIIGPNSHIISSVIGAGSVLDNTVCENSRVGKNNKIGPFTHIRPNTVLEDNVHMGNFTEAKNSNIGNGTKVSHLTYIGDSDVGERVNFGCGTVTSNYTGVQKFRTKIGNDAFIGCNTNLVAPVKVGDRAYTAAGSTITDDVPDDSLALARNRQINKENWHIKKK